MKKSKKYTPTFYLGIKNSLIFRSNLVFGWLIQLTNLFVSLWMWYALLKNNNFIDMAKYLIITNTTALIFTTSPLYMLSNLIQSGRLSICLTKPISIYWYLFFYNMGKQLPLLLFYIGLFILFAHNALVIFILFMYLALSTMMFFNLMIVLGSLGFWLINMWPLRNGINAIYLLLGGLYFPLTMLGKDLYRWLQYNPFSLITDVPARMIVGNSTNNIMQYYIAVIIWGIVFYYLGKFLFKKGMKVYEGIGV